jgi:hypothetical protein
MVSIIGTLRTLAGALMKIGNEVRWYACGSRAGICELCNLNLPKQTHICSVVYFFPEPSTAPLAPLSLFVPGGKITGQSKVEEGSSSCCLRLLPFLLDYLYYVSSPAVTQYKN